MSAVRRAVPAALSVAALVAALHGQAQAPVSVSEAGGWPTAQADAQRTSWLRADPYISLEAMRKGGFALQWKTVIQDSRGPNLFAGGVATGGRKPITVVASRSNAVYAVDTDTGIQFWERHFDDRSRPAACGSDMPAVVTRSTGLSAPAAGASTNIGFGAAVREAYHSGVGEPGEGVPAALMGRAGGGAARAAGTPAPAAPGVGAPGRAAAPAGGAGAGAGAAGAPTAPAGAPAARGRAAGGGRATPNTYVVAQDGVLHFLGDGSGKDLQKPAPFLPAGARASDPIVVNGVVYASTWAGCQGATDAVWAFDAGGTGAPMSWAAPGHPLGSPAMGADGTLYVAVLRATPEGQDSVVALDPRTLAVKDTFTTSLQLGTPPVVVTDRGREFVILVTRSGLVVQLDAHALGGADRKTPQLVSGPFFAETTSNASRPAVWQDANGQTWLFLAVPGPVPGGVHVAASNGRVTSGTILGLRLGATSIDSVWASPDLVAPSTPLVINGVVFALGGGLPMYRSAGTRPVPAVLLALDPASGAVVWTSGKTIPVSAAAGALWGANSQVLVAGSDNTIYGFGFAMERH